MHLFSADQRRVIFSCVLIQGLLKNLVMLPFAMLSFDPLGKDVRVLPMFALLAVCNFDLLRESFTSTALKCRLELIEV